MKKVSSLLIYLTGMVACAQVNTKVEPALNVLQEFDKVRDFSMTQEGTEAYFTIQSQHEEVSVISVSLKKDGDWQKPEIASFSGKYKDIEPFLSPDGLRLYFVSNRPLDEEGETKDFDIWYVDRADKNAKWSEPINLGAPVNTEYNEFYPAVATNGNLYYTCDGPEAMGKDDIFFSAFENGSYSKPVALGEAVNSEGFEYNAYISRGDTFLIFGGYNREDGLGSGDMYISFKDTDGNWSKAAPLPQPLNSRFMDYCPFVDETNGVFYFTSRRSTNPGGRLQDMATLKSYLDSYQNGGSRLYKVNYKVSLPQ
ncbi:PD40 domain-containing protein [Flagellimonas flava]|uniref:WD40-like Beta Propeller Repeat n=1 Tax=Flagellimonas flava TaxID=570519 RepID=A0A1M5IZ96_9FLAO|nr:PD40 domain-containing protein [Allomuricauda flava]SHG33657.1 WD40-like Beta Propeller Repeat [Allomuricauda flava]